jgi:hypothetical protein
MSHTRPGAARPDAPPAAATAAAVLLATATTPAGTPAALLPWGDGTVLSRLAAALAASGAGDLRVVVRPEHEGALVDFAPVLVSPDPAADLRLIASLAREAAGPVVLAHGDLVVHPDRLARLVAGGDRTEILAGPPAAGTSPVRTHRGRVLSAGSPQHDVSAATGAFQGVLKVGSADVSALASAAERLAGSPAEDVVALALVGLVRSGAPVAGSESRAGYWAQPRSEAEAAHAGERVAAHDDDRDRLDAAVKANDGFFTTHFVSPYSKYLARWAARRGLTPNQVTTFSLALGLASAAAFATGERWGLIAGAVLLQLAFTADCVDGQLARYTRSFSAFGAWLDSVFDRSKEYLVYAGLALGASRAGDPVWLLACSALTLQTIRHMSDFSFAADRHVDLTTAAQPPLEQRSDRVGAAPAAPAAAPAGTPRPTSRRLLGGWARLDRAPGFVWLKKVIAFPIGERFAAISLAAALSGPRTAFVVLLAWGGFATVYSHAGRVLRSIAR